MMSKHHYYPVVSPSPWPIIVSINSFSLMFSIMMLFKAVSSLWLFFCIFNMVLSSMSWWISYTKECNTLGEDSMNMGSAIKYSMILFISSEVLFFFSFFWSYFHFYLSPTMEVGLSWPPLYLSMFDYSNVPMINTLILMSSGVFITISHMYLNDKKIISMSFWLFCTILMGLIFTILQLQEYYSSFFTLSDSSFGTSFFVLTGFHGIHVMAGTIFLFYAFSSSIKFSYSENDFSNFELSSWYWHFVDVVWIFLYFFLYYVNN